MTSPADIIFSLKPENRFAMRKMAMYEQVELAKMSYREAQLDMQRHKIYQDEAMHRERMAMEDEKMYQADRIHIERMQHDEKLQGKAQEHNERMQERQIQGQLEATNVSGMNARILSAQEHYQRLAEERQKKRQDLLSDLVGQQVRTQLEIIANFYNTSFEVMKAERLAEQNHRHAMEMEKLRGKIEQEKIILQAKIESEKRDDEHTKGRAKHTDEITENRAKEEANLKRLIFESNILKTQKFIDLLINNERVQFDGLNSIVMEILRRILLVGDTREMEADEIGQLVKDAVAQMQPDGF